MKQATTKAVGLIIMLMVLGACAQKVVGIYNPGTLKKKPQTFYVYPLEEVNDTTTNAQRQLDSTLVKTIDHALKAKGLTTGSLPDLYISFMINVHTGTDESNNNQNYYPYNSYRYYDYRYTDPFYYQSSKSYKEGIFIIEVRNEDNKLVWQGSKTFRIRAKESLIEVLPPIGQEIIDIYNPAKY